MIKPSQIREREFSKSTMGGYKTAEVDSFLDDVAVSYEQLYKENSELLKKLRLLVDNIEDYRKKEQEGELTPDASLTAAREEADKIIADARLQAQRIIGDAESQAEEFKGNSSSLDELRQLREKEEKKLADIRSESEKFKKSLLSMYTEHLTLIQSMVDGAVDVKDEEIKSEEADAEIKAAETDEKKSAIQNIEVDEKFAYDDIDVFFAEAVSQEQGRIKEAFGGFRFEMGVENTDEVQLELEETISDFEEPISDAIVIDEPVEDECVSNEPVTDEQEIIHIEFEVDASEDEAAAEGSEAQSADDELKPNFKISFPENEASDEADEENLDDLFAGFFNSADKSE